MDHYDYYWSWIDWTYCLEICYKKIFPKKH